MKYIERILLLLTLLTAPFAAMAQVREPQKKTDKSEIKVNKLDVIYEEEEFKGVVIDHRNDKETEQYLYTAPFIFETEDELETDDADELPGNYNLSDEGAASEDEILIEGFDTSEIHREKLDVSRMVEPVTILLRDESQANFSTGRHRRAPVRHRTSVRAGAASTTASTWRNPRASPSTPPSTGPCAYRNATALTATWSSSSMPTDWRPTMPTCRSAWWTPATT